MPLSMIFSLAVLCRHRGGSGMLVMPFLVSTSLEAADLIPRTPNSSAFIEKHLENRLPELSLSSVNKRNAGPISLAVYLDVFLKEQIQVVNKTGWQVQITRSSQPGISPLSSRPDPTTKTVKIAVTTKDISKLGSDNNFAFSYFWLGLLHELENAQRASEFVRLSERARRGTITRLAFVEREIQMECHSFSQALRTYRQVLIPLVKRNSNVTLNDFSARWPQHLSAKQARYLLNWDEIEIHYEKWYEKVSGLGTKN